MGKNVRTFDWSATALGPITGWPRSLRSAVGIALRPPAPVVLLWGDEGHMIYNDAYAQFAADRHPQLLGSRVREGWPEVADFNDHVMRVCLAGGTLTYQDQELILNRTGTPQPVWVDLAYSPLPDETGAPAGVIAIVVETTERVLAQRRAARVQDRQRMLLARMPGFVVDMRGPEHRFEYVNTDTGIRASVGRADPHLLRGRHRHDDVSVPAPASGTCRIRGQRHRTAGSGGRLG